MNTSLPERPPVGRRATALLLTAVIALALIGLVVGIDQGVPQHDVEPYAVPVVTGGPTLIPAVSYAALPEANVGPTRRWTHSLERLERPAPDPFAEVIPDPEQKRTSLARRAAGRAYNGAPPVIPHTVQQSGADGCLACHGAGFALADRGARGLPHPYFANCVQCHAPAAPAFLTDGAPAVAANTFDGMAAPFEGARAWTGAPPVIPHTTAMRNDCLACHGPRGWPGMETTHPWRENCLQCHAPTSPLDGVPDIGGGAFLPPPKVTDE